MTLKVYGIKNCSSMKKTFCWLNAKSIRYTFIDFKITAPTALEIELWLDKVGDSLINKRGTTYRQLPGEIKANFTGQTRLDTLHHHPTMIKRPLLINGDIILVGFLPDLWTRTENLLTD